MVEFVDLNKLIHPFPESAKFPNPLLDKLHSNGNNLAGTVTMFECSSLYNEKLRMVLTLNEFFKLLPTQSMVVSRKDGVKAAAARNAGNDLYVRGEYLNAMTSYNKSLCLSEKGSENMGLAYANRSAVYFKLGYYKICLENIELALENGYPEKNKFKLLTRKEDCLTAINNGQGKKMKPEEVNVKLSYRPNPKFPYMVEGIKLAKNKKYGYHYVATENFNPGDVLMIEKPLIEYLDVKKAHVYCFYCLKSNLLSLLPCEESTYAMFCSKSCYDEAMKKFFKYEGPIVDAIYEHLKVDETVIRLVLKLIIIFGNLDDLKKKLDSMPENNFNPHAFDFDNSTEKDLLLAFCSLPALKEATPTVDAFTRFQSANWSIWAFHLIKNFTGVGQLITTEDHENFLMKLFYRLNLIEGNRGSKIQHVGLKGPGFSPVKGSRLSLFTNFLNHSCAPNVGPFGETKNVVAVLRPIKAGDQLFAAYGPDHNFLPRAERLKILKSHYCFDCDCVACQEDYPTMVDLFKTMKPSMNRQIAELPNIPIDEKTDRKDLMFAVKKRIAFIKKYDNLYPHPIINQAVELHKRAMLLLYSNKSLEIIFKGL